ncbi:MAG TPA: DUF6709 family protein [Candidatus Angelobacter sp.]|nr:DUF6709 family protein [Candidatus Angelobacter sp.]
MALWVENEARRANRNLLLVNGGILAIVILVIAGNYRYCANFVLGCQSISSAELAALASPEQRWRNFVSVSGTKSFNTEYRDVVNHMEGSRVVSTEIKDEYILLRVGDKILLVKADPGKENLEYSGELVPTTDQVRSDLLGPLAAEDAELARAVLPFTLNAADYRSNGYTMLMIGLPLLALALWNCLKAMRRISEIQLSPVWKHLAVYGNAEQLSQQIEAELQPAVIRKYGKLQIAQQWMVRRKTFSTWVSPVGDLVWVYKKVTKHSVNFIPTGKTYSVVLVGRHRQRIEEQMKEKAVNEMLADLAVRVPWVLFGFTKDLEKAWQKDPAGVIAAVDARSQQQNNKSAAAAAPGQ